MLTRCWNAIVPVGDEGARCHSVCTGSTTVRPTLWFFTIKDTCRRPSHPEIAYAKNAEDRRTGAIDDRFSFISEVR